MKRHQRGWEGDAELALLFALLTCDGQQSVVGSI